MDVLIIVCVFASVFAIFIEFTVACVSKMRRGGVGGEGCGRLAGPKSLRTWSDLRGIVRSN